MTTPHDTFREQLLDLAYGELGRREARALRAHVDACDECRTELARITATRSAMSGLGTVPAPERGEAVLLAAAREAARARAPKPFLPPWVWGASIGAVAAAAAVVLSVKLAPDAHPVLSPPTELAGDSMPEEERAERHQGREGMPPPAPTPAPDPRAGPEGAEPARTLAKEEERPVPERKRAAPTAPKRAPAPANDDRFAAAPPPSAAAPAAGAPAAPAESRLPPASAAPEPRADAVARPSPPAKPMARSEADAPAEAYAEKAPADRLAAAAQADAEDGASRAVGGNAGAPPKAKKGTLGALGSASGDPVAFHARLAAAGALHAETRAFEDCPGETVRVVESDPDGRTVKVTRRGTAAGAPYVLEQYYGADGALAAVHWSSEQRVHEVRLGPGGPTGAVGTVPAFALEPRRASAAAAAPPRCGE